jgi:hypothetical protein
VARWRALGADIAALDGDLTTLLAGTDGQILTTLPGVTTCRAAAFAAFSLPIARFPSPEHSTRSPVWPRPATSPPRSTAAGGSPARACPSTATP